jgi:hypothetical protein
MKQSKRDKLSQAVLDAAAKFLKNEGWSLVLLSGPTEIVQKSPVMFGLNIDFIGKKKPIPKKKK